MGQVLRQHPHVCSVLGREKTIRRLRRQDMMTYIENHYGFGQTVVSIAGNFEQAKLDWLVAQYFGKGRSTKSAFTNGRHSPNVRGGVLLKKKRLEQVHLCLGLKGVAAGHQDRYALY